MSSPADVHANDDLGSWKINVAEMMHARAHTHTRARARVATIDINDVFYMEILVTIN